jgi:CTD small phosphatase-like protein 2
MEDEMGKAYVSLRPYALSFLKRARKYYEIIVFTASDRSYADVILDEIDPDHALIDHRLYREHCVKLANQVYAKDLKITNREMSQTILVDNSPISYLYQLDNGVPILPYYGGEDVELLHL